MINIFKTKMILGHSYVTPKEISLNLTSEVTHYRAVRLAFVLRLTGIQEGSHKTPTLIIKRLNE